jgi:ATP-dependent DNA ligase
LVHAGHGFTARFSEIARACDKRAPGTLTDGEVVAIVGNGRVSFNALQHRRPRAHIQFYPFDILIHRGLEGNRVPSIDLEFLCGSHQLC